MKTLLTKEESAQLLHWLNTRAQALCTRGDTPLVVANREVILLRNVYQEHASVFPSFVDKESYETLVWDYGVGLNALFTTAETCQQLSFSNAPALVVLSEQQENVIREVFVATVYAPAAALYILFSMLPVDVKTELFNQQWLLLDLLHSFKPTTPTMGNTLLWTVDDLTDTAAALFQERFQAQLNACDINIDTDALMPSKSVTRIGFGNEFSARYGFVTLMRHYMTQIDMIDRTRHSIHGTPLTGERVAHLKAIDINFGGKDRSDLANLPHLTLTMAGNPHPSLCDILTSKKGSLFIEHLYNTLTELIDVTSEESVGQQLRTLCKQGTINSLKMQMLRELARANGLNTNALVDGYATKFKALSAI